MEIKIIEVKEITLPDGKKFNAYKALAKGGRKMDCRFVKGCTNVPTEPCVIVVDDNEANVDTTKQYPVLWVKDVKGIKPYERKNNLNDYFGDTE